MTVGPHGISAALPVHLEVVVAGQALPRAESLQLTLLQQSLVDAPEWEVVIALNEHRVVGLGDGHAFPDRPHTTALVRARSAQEGVWKGIDVCGI